MISNIMMVGGKVKEHEQYDVYRAAKFLYWMRK